MRDGDRELARRFPAADDDVMRDVYARFGGSVHTVALSIVRERARAADVVQSTFLNAWRSAATFDPSRQLGPWLYAIARRQAIDSYRKERRLTVTDPDDLDVVDLPPSLERTWETFEVRAAVDALDPDEREVMRLAWFEDLTHPEIAVRLDIPVGTVKSRSHRAHRRLAAALAHLRHGAAPNHLPGGDVVSDSRTPTSERKHQ
ncbi:N/A [soil metagenome]